MQKKTFVVWGLAATAVATALTVYALRKKKAAFVHHKRTGKHLTKAFARAKAHAEGEYTL
jgi:hypothetical protein